VKEYERSHRQLKMGGNGACIPQTRQGRENKIILAQNLKKKVRLARGKEKQKSTTVGKRRWFKGEGPEPKAKGGRYSSIAGRALPKELVSCENRMGTQGRENSGQGASNKDGKGSSGV